MPNDAYSTLSPLKDELYHSDSPIPSGMESARIATYFRVSTDDQNISMQEAVVDTLIRNQGFDPNNVLVFKDEGISATKMGNLGDRPQGSELIEAITNGEITHLFAYRVDRLFRDTESGASFVKWMRANHPDVSIMTTDCPMPITSADGEFFFGFQVLLARREAAVLATRTTSGMETTADQLKVVSHSIYGWNVCHNVDGEKTMRPNWKEIAVMEWMKKSNEDGLSFAKIARQLNDWGIRTKTGREWSSSGASRTVTRPAKYHQQLHQFERPTRMPSPPFRTLSVTQK